MPQTHPIRLNILSDLHLSRAGQPLPTAVADIVILAGDISRPKEALAWATGFTQPVLYVPGNHEFYGGSLDGTLEQLKHYAQGTGVRILDNDEVVLNGIRFLGSTLWGDFNLYGDDAREQSIKESLAFNRDFSRIESRSKPGTPFSPAEMETLFHANRAWLRQKLAEAFNGPTVVITHHAPSTQSIHPRFEGSLVNACFVSDNEDLMGAERVVLWIHGHTHDSFDYQVEGTRVVCNPRGYVRDGVNENPDFNPDFVVELAVN